MNAINTLTDYIQQYGTAASVALFDPAFKIFKTDSVNGIIGYRPVGKCAVVFGDPLCAEQDRHALASAFHEHCKNNNMSIVYTAVSNQFRELAMQGFCKAALQIGHEMILDPQKDPRHTPGPHANLLRRKIKKSIFDGIFVHEYVDYDPTIEYEINEVAHAWLSHRSGPQLYYAKTNLFADKSTKRWFYAQQGDAIIGVLVISRINTRKGWVINNLMKHPDAPDYVSEYMVISAMDTLRAEGCRYFSTGPTILTHFDYMEGMNKTQRLLIKAAVQVARVFFKILQDHQRFWRKFEPRKEPSFMLFSNSSIGYREVKGIMNAFNVQFFK